MDAEFSMAMLLAPSLQRQLQRPRPRRRLRRLRPRHPQQHRPPLPLLPLRLRLRHLLHLPRLLPQLHTLSVVVVDGLDRPYALLAGPASIRTTVSVPRLQL